MTEEDTWLACAGLCPTETMARNTHAVCLWLMLWCWCGWEPLMCILSLSYPSASSSTGDGLSSLTDLLNGTWTNLGDAHKLESINRQNELFWRQFKEIDTCLEGDSPEKELWDLRVDMPFLDCVCYNLSIVKWAIALIMGIFSWP